MNVIKGEFTQQVGATFLTHLIGLLFSIVNAAIIARYLGPDGKGMVALVLLLPNMMGLFLSLGIGTANVFFVGSRHFEVSTLTSNSATFALVGTVIGVGITLSLSGTGWLSSIVPGVPVWLVLCSIPLLPIGLASGYFTAILQGLQRITAINVVRLAQGGILVLLTGLLVAGFPTGLLGSVTAYVVSGALGLLVLSVVLRREGGVPLPKWDSSVARSTVSFGLKGHIGNIFQFFNYRLDLLIVNYFLGPGNVGIYSVSVGLAECLWYFPNAVGFVIFPKAAATKPELMNIFTPRAFRITLLLTALGAIGLMVFGKPMILMIYSSSFVSAYMPMLALLPGVVFLGSGKVLTNEIAGRGYPHYNSINAGLALVVTVVLDLVLIPRYGVLGAALASSIAYTAIFFTAIGFYVNVSRKKHGRSS